MDLSNTAIEVKYKNHGTDIIRFYKSHGYLNTDCLNGKASIGYYYAVYNNVIICVSPAKLDLSLYKIITIDYLEELNIWI